MGDEGVIFQSYGLQIITSTFIGQCKSIRLANSVGGSRDDRPLPQALQVLSRPNKIDIYAIAKAK